MTRLKRTGVYRITNIYNGKIYIGSTAKSFSHRWGVHRLDFRKGKHCNKYFQRAWNKYGKDAFLFEIIEFCEVSEVLKCEQKWLDHYKSYDPKIGYNLDKIAGSRLGSTMPIGTRAKKQDIFVFTQKGERVDYFTNTSEAAHTLFGHRKYSKMITGNLNGGRGKKSYKEYVFSNSPVFPGYKTEFRGGGKWSEVSKQKASNTRTGVKRPYLNQKGIPKPATSKSLEQWKDGVLIKIWPSNKEVRQKLGISNVQMVAKGRNKSAGGFQWKYHKQIKHEYDNS